jgi:hypothetical protein
MKYEFHKVIFTLYSNYIYIVYQKLYFVSASMCARTAQYSIEFSLYRGNLQALEEVIA